MHRSLKVVELKERGQEGKTLSDEEDVRQLYTSMRYSGDDHLIFGDFRRHLWQGSERILERRRKHRQTGKERTKRK